MLAGKAVFLIPAIPAVVAGVLILWGKRMREPVAGWIATGAIGASFALSIAQWLDLLGRHAEERRLVYTLYEWIPAGSLDISFDFLVDPLSIVMILVVSGVGSLIHLYSIGYMHGDPRFSRFFAYLNLFAASMLLLVLANNLVLMFLGWEGVGLCSYLLISFWFEKDTAAVAGKKAFVTNRVGDFGFMLGALLLFSQVGTLQLVGGKGGGLLAAGPVMLSSGMATAATLLLFLGAAGKSAQLPLFVWLPDAMEGPTPVSALIHAATMVTAGVYMVARTGVLFELSPVSPWVVAFVGTATAVIAASIALVQYDLKRVLAYSTVSQLGFMFAAVGLGAYASGIFHLVTHAFFKALLFLGAGSVMHAMGNRTDIRGFGGLRKVMPWTAGTWVVGWLAILGFPPLAGFFSKDSIMAAALAKGGARGIAIWILLGGAAFLTAIYMSRATFLTFFGKARWEEAGEAGEAGVHPHESPKLMTIPLAVLALAAAIGGLLGIPKVFHPIEDWLEPSVVHHAAPSMLHESVVMVVAGLLMLGAIALAVTVWLKRDARARGEMLGKIPAGEAAYGVFRKGWGFDALNELIFVRIGGRFAGWLADSFDAKGVDGVVNGVARGVYDTGEGGSRLQTGYVRNYALAVLAGAVVVGGAMLIRYLAGAG